MFHPLHQKNLGTRPIPSKVFLVERVNNHHPIGESEQLLRYAPFLLSINL